VSEGLRGVLSCAAAASLLAGCAELLSLSGVSNGETAAQGAGGAAASVSATSSTGGAAAGGNAGGGAGGGTGGSSYAPAEVIWALHFDGPDASELEDLALAADGSVWLTGTASGAVQIGSQPIDTGGSGSDVLVVHLSTAGATLDVAHHGSGGAQYGRAIALDRDAPTMHVASRWSASAVFGSNTVASGPGENAVLLTYDVSAAVAPVRGWSYGNDLPWSGDAVAEDGSLRALGGRYRGDYVPGSLTGSMVDDDAVVMVVDDQGMLLWTDGFGSIGDDAIEDLAFDPGGDLFIAGGFNGAIVFGANDNWSVNAGVGQDGLVARYVRATGAIADAWEFGAANGGDSHAYSVALDADTVVVGGDVRGSVDFGQGTVVTNDSDALVAKLDKNDLNMDPWVLLGSQAPGDQEVRDVVVDADGNVVVAGMHTGPFTLAGLQIDHSGGQDIFVAKLAPDGSGIWAQSFGDAANQSVRALGVDAAGNVYLAGSFEGAPTFGALLLVNGNANRNMFVAKLAP
jgi:hypothetical protein